jgi:hypothetical protein
LNIVERIKPIPFHVGATAFFILLPLIINYIRQPNPGAFMDKESMVMGFSWGTAMFICTSCAYLLLRAVCQLRLHAGIASIVFVLVTIGADFIPGQLMVLSQTNWPYTSFGGDQGWFIILAPISTALYLLPLLIVFFICLLVVVCKNASSKTLKGQPSSK